MKKILLFLSLLLFALLPVGAVKKFETLPVKKIDANPINLAAMLTEQSDTAVIVSICEYYGYKRQQPKDHYTIFTHPNGSTIRYVVSDTDISHPTIEVYSKLNTKKKNQILKDLNFKKNGVVYERGSIGYTTRCLYCPQGFLRFTSLHSQKN